MADDDPRDWAAAEGMPPARVDRRRVLHLVGELERDPALRGVLQDALALHEEHVADVRWPGFEAGEVHSQHHVMRRLLAARVVDQVYRSRSSTQYRLADVDGVREALRLNVSRPPGPADAAVEIPADLFAVVVGLEQPKAILRRALVAERPVHVLLEGPPASAKSLILAELERLPGARRAMGPTTTRAGIVSYLLAEPDCTHLLVDELDQMDGRDQLALYGVMAEGRVERLQHGHAEQEARDVWVFATANDASRLRAPLLSRFVTIRLAPYSDEEFRQVACAVLEQRRADPELAREIAQAVSPHTRDPRKAVSIYLLCGGDRREVTPLVEALLADR